MVLLLNGNIRPNPKAKIGSLENGLKLMQNILLEFIKEVENPF
jgi:hypothetical protein